MMINFKPWVEGFERINNVLLHHWSIYIYSMYNRRVTDTHIRLPLDCVQEMEIKSERQKAYSLCGWKLSFQLAKHPVRRSIHLSGPSLVATLRACSFSLPPSLSLLLPPALYLSLSGLRLFSDPDTGQPLPLPLLSSTEEAGEQGHTGRHCIVTAPSLCLHPAN